MPPKNLLPHKILADDIKTPYKVTPGHPRCTDGYLWKAKSNLIYFRHNASSRIFVYPGHPGPDQIYLVENHPIAFETNNYSTQKLALELRDEKAKLEKKTRDLEEEINFQQKEIDRTEAVIQKLLLEKDHILEREEYQDAHVASQTAIIANLKYLKIASRKTVEKECNELRNMLLSGRGEVSFEMLTPDLTTAIRVSWEAQQKLRKQLLASNLIQLLKDAFFESTSNMLKKNSYHLLVFQQTQNLYAYL
eukprot:g10071.t1